MHSLPRTLRLSAALALVFGGGILGVSAAAADDGYFNVTYDDIGLSLTQMGGYGELVVSPQGFGSMSYGTCTINYTRDESGAIKEMAPVVQGNSAKCPEELRFSLAPGDDGFYKITFEAGGDLTGKTLDLFPVLRPMSDALRVATPAGFDILGLTIGQTRAEAEAILEAKGYKKVEDYTGITKYEGGFSKSSELWGKGEYVHDADRPTDEIALTYTPLPDAGGGEEKVELLARTWNIPAADNLSLAALKKSLNDKHGATTSGFESRFYDFSGALQPQAFQYVCSDKVHLQQVVSRYSFHGMSGDLALSPACGAKVDIMTTEDYDAPGRASLLKIILEKGDVAYEGFWQTWSKTEAEALKQRYELQANMSGAAPEL